MNRKYNTKEFEDSVKLLRNAFPNVALTTDIIAGFPGESDEEFYITYEYLKKCNSKISTALRFNIQLDILGEKELIFEEIVESISEIKKKELIQKSNKGSSRQPN